MTDMEISRIRDACAESDLRRVKREGEILIAQTIKGTVRLARADDGYVLVTCGHVVPETLAAGKRKVVKAALAKLYDVEI
jgi:hypothetical protein